MNRQTTGPVDPSNRKPATDARGSPGRGHAWGDALRALRGDAARKRGQDEAAAQQALPGGASSDPLTPSDQNTPTEFGPPQGSEPAAPHAAPAGGSPRPSPADPPAVEPPAVDPPAMDPPAVDEALEALQALARRYAVPAAAHPPAPAEQAVPPPPDRVEPDDAEYEAPAPEVYEEPAPGVRLLTRRARWTSIALILVSAAVLAVLLVGALSLSRQLFQSSNARTDRSASARQNVVQMPSSPTSSSATPSSPTSSSAFGSPTTVVAVASPSATGVADMPAIEKAMADCDQEAAANPDALYFLIVPAVSPMKDYSHWAPLSVGDIGTSIILLRSKDALDGLRNGSLAVYSGPYRFSIIDSSTEITHDWGPVKGVAKFIKLDAAAIGGFRVRFSFADLVGDSPSNFRFPRDKGVCYWVSALLRT